jgi:hypothetical protein
MLTASYEHLRCPQFCSISTCAPVLRIRVKDIYFCVSF